MKKSLLLIIMALLCFNAFSQQWLYFPSGINNNRIDIGNLAITGNSITIEALITTRSSSPQPIAYDIVSKHFDSNDCNYLFRPNQFAIRTSTGFIALANPEDLCNDTTYHVAGTYDGDSIKYYVNGIEVSSQAKNGNLTQNTHTTGIGNRYYTGAGFYEQFIGYIDEVRIWNVARSQTDILNNMYNLPNPTAQTGLLAYYNFDGNYFNLQGNTAYNGTPVGIQLQDTINPFFSGVVSSTFCTPVGVAEDESGLIFKVYPNPNAGIFKIEFSESIQKCNIEILNILGENIFEAKTYNESIKEIKLQNICPGFYFIKVQDREKIFTQKIIIK